MGPYDTSSSVIEVKLDGIPVNIPMERRSFAAIRSYLESLALQQQRVLCWISVDGQQVNLSHPRKTLRPFSQVEGETISLNEVPVQLIKAAIHQASAVRARVQSAVELVLINERDRACELWWSLSTALKEPLLTLSLLPENSCGPANAGASLMQLRKWQLQQLGSVIHDIDIACRSMETVELSDALENRALPWLDSLQESLQLWHDTISSAPAGTCPGA